MFRADHHNPNCQNPDHRDDKEYRLNYRAPWSELNKLINRFKDNEWLSVRVVMSTSQGKTVCGVEGCPHVDFAYGNHMWSPHVITQIICGTSYTVITFEVYK